MVQAVGGSSQYYGYQAPQGTTPVQSGTYQTSTAYQNDAYQGGQYYAASTSPGSGSLSAVIGNATVSSRLSMFLINSPERLLKVGAGMGSVGRFFIKLLAGNVPFVTPSVQQAQIDNDVRTWLSTSDLMRTGAAPHHAQLLQDVGIWRVQDLAVYVNPSDQGVLAQRLVAAGAARGIADLPTQQSVAHWVANAGQLSTYNF